MKTYEIISEDNGIYDNNYYYTQKMKKEIYAPFEINYNNSQKKKKLKKIKYKNELLISQYQQKSIFNTEKKN